MSDSSDRLQRFRADQHLLRMTIDDLPPELVARITEVAHAAGPMGDPMLLSAASLVCRRWRDPAQRELFAHVVLDLDTYPDQGQRWLASPARQRYRVRSMDLTRGGASDEGDEAEQILLQCEGVRTLTLLDLLEPDKYDFNGNLDPSESVPWDILRLPSLSGVATLNLPRADQFVEPPDDSPLLFRPTHIRLWLDSDYTVSAEFMHAFFQASSTSLRHLSLRLSHDDAASDLAADFHLVAHGLETLSLTITQSDESLDSLVVQCSSLKRLELWCPPDYASAFLSAVSNRLDEIAAALANPATIHQLVIIRGAVRRSRALDSSQQTAAPLFVALRAPAFSALRQLVFQDISRNEFDQLALGNELDPLHKECEAREIDLRFHGPEA